MATESLTLKLKEILSSHTEEGILNVLFALTVREPWRWNILGHLARVGQAYLRAQQAGLSPRIEVIVR